MTWDGPIQVVMVVKLKLPTSIVSLLKGSDSHSFTIAPSAKRLARDPVEANNLIERQSQRAKPLIEQWEAWARTVKVKRK